MFDWEFQELHNNEYTRHSFCGVYTIYTLNKIITTFKPTVNVYSAVVNTNNHWVAFHMDLYKKQLEFFDSFGDSPEKFPGISEFVEYLSNNLNIHITFNKYRFQSKYSMMCGHYCVYYLYCKCGGLSIEGMFKNFSRSEPDVNLLENDKYLYWLVQQHYKLVTRQLSNDQFYSPFYYKTLGKSFRHNMEDPFNEFLEKK